jgi:hypothetical protein
LNHPHPSGREGDHLKIQLLPLNRDVRPLEDHPDLLSLAALWFLLFHLVLTHNSDHLDYDVKLLGKWLQKQMDNSVQTKALQLLMLTRNSTMLKMTKPLPKK